jgi:hypothetical protein
MHLVPDKALLYLKNEYEIVMSDRTLRRWKQRIRTQVNDRLYYIAQYEFPIQHAESIEEIETGRKLMWKNILKIKDPYKQNLAIQNVLNLLPLKSQYYDNTRGVIEKPNESAEETVIQESTEQPTAEEWA